MKLEAPIRPPVYCARYKIFPTRAVVLLLLIAVPVLSTLARNSWYLSSSNPGHYLLTASKMKVAHAPVLSAQEALQPIVIFVQKQPTPQVKRSCVPEDAKPFLGVTVSIQTHRRPPPVSLS